VQVVDVLAQHLQRKVVTLFDDAADLVVDLARDLFRVVGLAPMSRPRNGMSWLRPSTRGPSFSLIPKRMTIAFAVCVTFSMSFDAPVVTSLKTSSSAARPPIVIAICSSSALRVVR
jgi:hypothetical protein